MPFRLDPPRDRKLYRLVKKAETVKVVKGRWLYAPGDAGHGRSGSSAADSCASCFRVWSAVSASGPSRWRSRGRPSATRRSRRGTVGTAPIAGSACEVSPLPKTAVLQGLEDGPKRSLDAYLEGQERELHRLRHAQGGSHGPTAAQRLAEVLIDLGARCGEPSGRGMELSERLTHQVLADLAGAHRATVTTLLNDWLYEGCARA